MSHEQKFEGTDEAWEEERLGASEDYVKISNDLDEDSVNQALELHPISIRLQKALVDDLKHIAAIHGIGYQPLMRQVLNRFVESEKKQLLREKRRELEREGNEPDCDQAANG